MNPLDPNVQSVEAVAQALGDLCDEVVLVGGCAAGLLCTSPSAAPPRVTFDVDVVTEVAALAEYYALEKRFEQRGFHTRCFAGCADLPLAPAGSVRGSDAER